MMNTINSAAWRKGLLLPSLFATMALAIGGCSKSDEAPPPVVTDTAPATAAATASDDLAETAEAVTESPAEVVEAVEESAAVENPEETAAEQDLRLASEPASPASSSKYKKGTHYTELVPAQPKVEGTDKIEVVEVFWYGCGHCFAFEPYIKRWQANMPADVTFVKMPAIWNATLETHAKAYYTAEILARSGELKNPGAFHDAFFSAIHKDRQPLASPRSIKAFFERFGVSSEAYDSASSSFDLDQKIRKAKDLSRRYRVSGVPAIVVNGKYTNVSNAIRGYDEYLELIDTLVALER